MLIIYLWTCALFCCYFFFLCIIGIQSVCFTANNACWASSAPWVFLLCVGGRGERNSKHFIYLLNWAGVLNIYLDMCCKNVCRLCINFGISVVLEHGVKKKKACLSRGMYVKRWLLSTNKQHKKKKKKKRKRLLLWSWCCTLDQSGMQMMHLNAIRYWSWQKIMRTRWIFYKVNTHISQSAVTQERI